ncbi:MAG: PQQ-binding-like beta-propeller repeat protein [Acidobacteria bacterium]|nr:PQQ-binding-like beta-propeller repeat protein [Acidobacteriota bacterium]
MIPITRKLIGVVAALAAASTAGSTASTIRVSRTAWSMFKGDRQHTGQASVSGPRTATLKWRYRLSSTSHPSIGSPAVDRQNTTYITVGSTLAAIDANGQVTWSAALDGSGAAALSADESIVYAAGNLKLYAFRASTGAAVWTYSGPTQAIHGEPLVASDGTIYFGSWDADIYALNSDGTLKWRYQTDGGIAPLASPTLSNDERTLYVGTGDPHIDPGGSLYALDAATGAMRWRVSVDAIRASGPVVGPDDKVYVNGFGALHCFSSQGVELWQSQPNTASSLAPARATDGTIYEGTAQGRIYALNGANGSTKWSYQTGNNADPSGPSTGVLTAPIVGSDGVLYVGAVDGKLYAMNPTGTVLWTYQAGQAITESSPALVDGTIYFTSDDGYLYALDAGSRSLNMSVSGTGSVTSSPSGLTCSGASCSQQFSTGQQVSLAAAASTGNVFAGWGGDADCLDGAVSMATSLTCSAAFVSVLSGGASVGSVDLNGDGGGDALSYNASTGEWSMELGNRSGSFGSKRGTWAAGWTVRAADFNGDRLTDFFLYNPTTGAWAKAINTGAFDFTTFTGQWSPGWTPFIVDFDGNGRSDVFIYSVSTGVWFKCFSTGTGTGEFAYYTGQWDPGWEMQPADWDGDRRTDLFLFRRTDGLWIRVTNDGGAGFSYYSETWSPIWSFFTGDFTGDGKTDVFLYAASGLWFLCTNTGTSFSYASDSWSPGWGISVGDFDGNGKADLYLYNATSGVWVEALSTGLGSFTYASGTIAAGWQVTLTDLNGDRKSDVVLYNPTTGAWAQGINTGVGAFTYGAGAWAANLTIVVSGARIP